MNLTAKSFVVTGASGGIGAAIARSLALRGVRVVLQGRDTARLQTVLRQIGGVAKGHSVVVGDLTDATTRAALVAHCRLLPRPLDGLINNAGAGAFAPLDQVDDAQLQQLLTLNLMMPIQITRDLLPLLKTRPEAAIVNVGSTFGNIGYAGFSVYCAAKFGLRGFTQALRRELADTAIAVQYLAPRATRTALNAPAVDALNAALGNAVDAPEAVADALVALLESGARSRFLGWPEPLFVALNQLAPAVIDRALRKQLSTIRSFFHS